MSSPNRKEAVKMRRIGIATLGMAVAFALIGFVPVEAFAADPHVAIHTGGVREAVTTVSPGDEVTWINVSGAHVVRVVFDNGATGAPEGTGLFTSSASLTFTRPGVYAYTAYVGSQALTHRGKIVVK